MIEVATTINSFASKAMQADFVPPSEESVFILTSGQLQDIIKEAIQPLQDEISDLKATVANLQDDVTALEATQETQADNQLIQLRLIHELRPKPEEGSPLLDELYKEMKAQGRKQTDFATAARMVKRSKARLFQLKAAIALDQRFILIPSESHSQKLLIRLRKDP
jgi:cell division septum initiation protein DivIVA